MGQLSVELSGQIGAIRRYLNSHPNETWGWKGSNGRVAFRTVIADSHRREPGRFGLQVREDFDLTARGVARLRQVAVGNRFNRIAPGAPAPAQLLTAALTDPGVTGRYLNVEEVKSATRAIATASAGRCTRIQLPERTCEGRTCWALQLGIQGRARAPTMFVIGGIHGCEWGSAEIALSLVTRLLQSAETNTDVTFNGVSFAAADVAQLLASRRIIVLPLANPDGRAFSQRDNPPGDPAWRKNRSTAACRADPGDTTGAIGVDVNRNFDFCFGGTGLSPKTLLNASRDPYDGRVYQGPRPFSEAESRNVRWLLDRFPGNGWLVDLHACAGEVICHWGHDETQDTDPLMSFGNGQLGLPNDNAAQYMSAADSQEQAWLADVLCRTIESAQGPVYGQVAGFSPANGCVTPGTCHDYAYSRHYVDPALGRVLGFVMEWGKGLSDPFPDWPVMQPIVDHITAALIAFAIAAGQPIGNP